MLNRNDDFRLLLTLDKLELTHSFFYVCATAATNTRIYRCCSFKISQAQILVMGSTQRQHKQPKSSNKRQNQSIDVDRQTVAAVLNGFMGTHQKKSAKNNNVQILNWLFSAGDRSHWGCLLVKSNSSSRYLISQINGLAICGGMKCACVYIFEKKKKEKECHYCYFIVVWFCYKFLFGTAALFIFSH